jgi:hypothetical protein
MSSASTALIRLEQGTAERAFAPAGIAELRRMVLMSVPSEHSKRNYARHWTRSSPSASNDSSRYPVLF